MKRRCLNCNAKPVKATADMLTTTRGGWCLYFCSARCGLQYAEYDAASTNEWCAEHQCWFHPDDRCYECLKIERDAEDV